MGISLDCVKPPVRVVSSDRLKPSEVIAVEKSQFPVDVSLARRVPFNLAPVAKFAIPSHGQCRRPLLLAWFLENVTKLSVIAVPLFRMPPPLFPAMLLAMVLFSIVSAAPDLFRIPPAAFAAVLPEMVLPVIVAVPSFSRPPLCAVEPVDMLPEMVLLVIVKVEFGKLSIPAPWPPFPPVAVLPEIVLLLTVCMPGSLLSKYSFRMPAPRPDEFELPLLPAAVFGNSAVGDRHGAEVPDPTASRRNGSGGYRVSGDRAVCDAHRSGVVDRATLFRCIGGQRDTVERHAAVGQDAARFAWR